MTLSNLNKAPFPWFGSKYEAAEKTWEALGDVRHYIEPFAGSLAILLLRPHTPNRNGFHETVNDADGFITNFWRSIKYSPKETAESASWPVSELDKHARSIRLLKWRESKAVLRLAGDPAWHSPKIAGWWVWVACISIGIGNLGQGSWWVDSNGLLRKLSKNSKRSGRGIDKGRPSLGGKRLINSSLRERGTFSDDKFHPMTMPELIRWFDYLSARLRHVDILNGDWTRVCKRGVIDNLSITQGKGYAGIFLDPPYGDVGRSDLYGKYEDMTVAAKVRQWCLNNGDNPKYRIVYAGYDVEGKDLEEAGWQVIEWFRKGGLKRSESQERERLWLSPHCLKPKKKARKGFFDET